MINTIIGLIVGFVIAWIWRSLHRAPDLYVQLQHKVEEIESRQKLIKKIEVLDREISGTKKEVSTFTPDPELSAEGDIEQKNLEENEELITFKAKKKK